jgi:DNA-binding protein Fis
MTTSKPLRDGINEAVIDYLQAKMATGEVIDVVEMAHEMVQSLVDMIMEQDKEHQAIEELIN